MRAKTDMHQADIIAAFKKKNTTLAAVSRSYGLSSGTLANALKRPWPKGEFIIAGYLGMHPSDIWPSRYLNAKGELRDREKLLRTKNLKLTEDLMKTKS
ncbi:helix-turn-helix domain-containing protein [Pantoea coffeiphila]|uniref:Ner winged helix-turn-helix DNA-binding domain-containing protein n=1 Tax=Pantoea coffeiphila TaxID=1465635 RepID=A0A2S9I881_9GAMM|nr:helix-turn-helix transcriptional regulator [Pantoea coffeiphila]PRD13991.1 hypothetical protein CQW29_18475 [Pantoea coffeiphila]